MASSQTQIPFGDGFLCLTANPHRILPVAYCDATGASSLALDYTNPLSPASLIQPGSVWNFQFLYRDPQLAGSGFNLSDALQATFAP